MFKWLQELVFGREVKVTILLVKMRDEHAMSGSSMLVCEVDNPYARYWVNNVLGSVGETVLINSWDILH